MAPVVPSSTINISLAPRVPFTTKKSNFLTKCSIPRRHTKQSLPAQKYTVPLSTSIRLFPHFRIGCGLKPKLRFNTVFASGTDVAVEEANPTSADNETSTAEADAPEAIGESSAKSDASPVKSKRTRPGRKSEMPPVKNEDLIPGATFTGKVRSIQPFGAFVDFGAFTDGLIHVSRLSNSFVKDVANVVSVGQEVAVTLLEANMETGRISLSMRGVDDPQQRDSTGSGDKSRPPRKTGQKFNQNRDDSKKTSKFVKGQDLEGTVKNLTRSGSFISLPEGEEGFLPTSEEADEGFGNMMGGSSLEVGQEVSVRVLRITRGQVTLTMKKEENKGELDAKLNQGVVYTATNPFVVAFRSDKAISELLDSREKKNEVVTETDTPVSTTDDALSKNLVQEETPEQDSESGIVEEVEASSAVLVEEGKGLPAEDQIAEEPSSLEEVEEKADESIVKDEAQIEKPEAAFSSTSQSDLEISGDSLSASEYQTEEPISDQPLSSIAEDVTSNISDDTTEKEVEVLQTSGESTDQTLPHIVGEDTEKADDVVIVKDEEVNTAEKDDGVESSAEQSSLSDPEIEPTESFVNVEVGDELGNVTAIEGEAQPSSDAQQNGNIATLSEQSGETSQKEATVGAVISPALVKQLREETGAGMMDCKRALSEAGGDIVKAQEYLRKKGLASADKKASRATAEGRIGSYIHDSRIGVLIEVNCETDFVARGEIFRELVEDLAMQVAACPQVQYLDTDDVPKEIVDKEKEIEMQKDDLLSKPEQIRSKIVDGRVRKRLEELTLLEQPFIKDDKVAVKDWVKQTISTIGENIKVKRFIRYNLGEGLEKKSQDFAAEVAAQTAAKPTSTPTNQEAISTDTKEPAESPKPVVSAVLVKQLRDETGAGMMDCKKALSETGGDLEKAQEYLRKKGLSTADKKSSRLAAEGRIGAYIHDSRIGVLIEVNCETDFVGRGQNFKELVDDLAMQAVACPQVRYVSIEDIPEDIVGKEKELELQRDDVQSKPENIREKIVEGRVNKRLSELALLEQPFIRDDSLMVKDLVKQTVAALGENIKVRRFVRFTLGETTDDVRSSDEA
ncbi:polyprotein of EF-Ts, chloroplastic [Andrographis paniculata]|uniref:polyprotein of EF-Ts, chloroplastic n=1 Tax=Andrographis paniculata TaxID=175694 RepID=UPI0021E983F2|nr:polyprotein of EF-Ts, chloroplastic [Andrographis paniculata]